MRVRIKDINKINHITSIRGKSMNNKAEINKCLCGRENVQFQCIKKDCPSYKCALCVIKCEVHGEKSDSFQFIEEIEKIEQKWRHLS